MDYNKNQFKRIIDVDDQTKYKFINSYEVLFSCNFDAYKIAKQFGRVEISKHRDFLFKLEYY